jgi:hypothetical protein
MPRYVELAPGSPKVTTARFGSPSAWIGPNLRGVWIAGTLSTATERQNMSENEAPETRGDERVDLIVADTNNDGKADLWVVDTDGDGKADLFQFDHDGDGKVDLTIIDRTQDGNPDEVIDGDAGLPPA